MLNTSAFEATSCKISASWSSIPAVVFEVIWNFENTREDPNDECRGKQKCDLLEDYNLFILLS